MEVVKVGSFALYSLKSTASHLSQWLRPRDGCESVYLHINNLALIATVKVARLRWSRSRFISLVR